MRFLILLLCFTLNAAVFRVQRRVAATVSPPAYVHKGVGGGYGSLTIAMEANTVTGNVLVGAAFAVNSSAITSVTDNCGTSGGGSNTYTTNLITTSNGDGVYFWAVVGYGKACTITVVMTGGTGWMVGVAHEVSGADQTTPVESGKHYADVQNTPGTGTDAITSTAITPTRNNCYLFGATIEWLGSSATIVSGTGMTDRVTDTDTVFRQHTEEYTQTTAASKAITFTSSTGASAYFLTVIVAIQPPS